MQIASYILLTFAAVAIPELVFRAPRGFLWLRLTPALIGLSACGVFQMTIYQFTRRVRVPNGQFEAHPAAAWWVVGLPAVCLTIAMALFLAQAMRKTAPRTSERRTALAWSGAVWILIAAFLAMQLIAGRSPAG